MGGLLAATIVEGRAFFPLHFNSFYLPLCKTDTERVQTSQIKYIIQINRKRAQQIIRINKYIYVFAKQGFIRFYSLSVRCVCVSETIFYWAN